MTCPSLLSQHRDAPPGLSPTGRLNLAMPDDISMPPAIRGLATTRTGYPIPVITPRGDMEESFTIVDLPETGPTAVCPCGDLNRPHKLGAICPDRQRHTMRRHRCGVCGNRIDRRSGFTFIRSDRTTTVWIEPPLHQRCMAYSIRVCPVLADAGRDSEILIAHRVELRERRVAPSPTGPGLIHRLFPLGDPTARSFGALEYIAALPVNPTVHPALHWRDHLAPPLA